MLKLNMVFKKNSFLIHFNVYKIKLETFSNHKIALFEMYFK